MNGKQTNEYLNELMSKSTFEEISDDCIETRIMPLDSGPKGATLLPKGQIIRPIVKAI